MSQVTAQSVRFQTALASIKLIQASAVLDLTEDDFDFLTSTKVWIATDGCRARRCVEACVYGTLDFVGYPRFPAPVEFIAAGNGSTVLRFAVRGSPHVPSEPNRGQLAPTSASTVACATTVRSPSGV